MKGFVLKTIDAEFSLFFTGRINYDAGVGKAGFNSFTLLRTGGLRPAES